jgi:hypothetical protein
MLINDFISAINLGGVPGGDRGIVKQGSNLWKTDIGKGRNL